MSAFTRGRNLSLPWGRSIKSTEYTASLYGCLANLFTFSVCCLCLLLHVCCFLPVFIRLSVTWIQVKAFLEMRTQIFCDSLPVEDDGIMSLGNLGDFSRIHAVSRPRRPESLATPLRKRRVPLFPLKLSFNYIFMQPPLKTCSKLPVWIQSFYCASRRCSFNMLLSDGTVGAKVVYVV